VGWLIAIIFCHSACFWLLGIRKEEKAKSKLGVLKQVQDDGKEKKSLLSDMSILCSSTFRFLKSPGKRLPNALDNLHGFYLFFTTIIYVNIQKTCRNFTQNMQKQRSVPNAIPFNTLSIRS